MVSVLRDNTLQVLAEALAKAWVGDARDSSDIEAGRSSPMTQFLGIPMLRSS
jgi:hypothetical protein